MLKCGNVIDHANGLRQFIPIPSTDIREASVSKLRSCSRHEKWTCSSITKEAPRRDWHAVLQKSAMYRGASPWSPFYVSQQKLKETRRVMCSQCSLYGSSGVTLRNLFPPYMTLADAFGTHCNLLNITRGEPTSMTLLLSTWETTKQLRVTLLHVILCYDHSFCW